MKKINTIIQTCIALSSLQRPLCCLCLSSHCSKYLKSNVICLSSKTIHIVHVPAPNITQLTNSQRSKCVLQSSKLKPLKCIIGIPSLAQPQFLTLPWMLSPPSGTDQEYLSQDTYHELLVQSFL
jgi:hypothetical protein